MIVLRKDPSKMIRGHHLVEVFTFVDYEPFARWENEPTGNRSRDYRQLKEAIADPSEMSAKLWGRFARIPL